MKSLDGRNNIKIYNLSSGKSLPEWLSHKKKRKLVKRDIDIQRRIELIQDFNMPDVSNAIKVTPNGQYILATGTYKPRVKCYEVSALSLKFERCFDAEVIDFLVLSEDYSKLMFLQEDRYIEFHNQGGRWFRTRIPKFGRDMTYHYPSCDLYIGTSGSEIYRLNLHEGKFLNSLQTDAPSINKCIFNPVHYLFTCGTDDGRVETWDPRSRHRVGILDCAIHMVQGGTQLPSFRSAKELGITSLAYYDSLVLGVGTQSGQILMFDIRNYKPMLIKDHMDGFPIIDIEFQAKSNKSCSLSSNALKIWDKDNGDPYTSIESDVKFNDLCTVPDSGMVFLAAEDSKMQIYFLPSLGPAPKWCGHLDSLVEELEEEDAPPAYDDYKFVTEHELRLLGLDSLIGTNILRAVMHGYYIDVRLYHKAKSAVSLIDKEHLTKQKVKQKILEEKEAKSERIKKKSLPNINQEPFMKLTEEAMKGSGDKALLASKVLADSRFGALFSKPEFGLDKDTEAFNLIQPLSGKNSKFRQIGEDSDDEAEDPKKAVKHKDPVQESESDSDSIVSSEDEESVEEEEEEETMQVSRSGESRSKSKNVKFKFESKHKASKHTETQAKNVSERTTRFISADTMEELKEDYREKRRLALADRLREQEDENGEEVMGAGAFGSREMKFTLGDSSSSKFDRLRKQQREHHQERKGVFRSTKKIKGKLRTKNSFL